MNQLCNLKIGLFALGGYFLLTEAVRDTERFPPSTLCSGATRVGSEMELFILRSPCPLVVGPMGSNGASDLTGESSQVMGDSHVGWETVMWSGGG